MDSISETQSFNYSTDDIRFGVSFKFNYIVLEYNILLIRFFIKF